MRAHKRKEQGKKKHGLVPASFAGKTKFIVFLESRKTETPRQRLIVHGPISYYGRSGCKPLIRMTADAHENSSLTSSKTGLESNTARLRVLSPSLEVFFLLTRQKSRTGYSTSPMTEIVLMIDQSPI